ncbi:MAG: tail fiber domain-containing protein [Dysgonamonadaceae bacterium]|jgi:hypothetical protein|nr:tail fiber domain-containing protein [Dysgonamonadaceae bacterium]
MKKLIFSITVLVVFLPMVLNAQMRVLSNGNVEVYSSGSVAHTSDESKLSIKTDRYKALSFNRSGSVPSGNWIFGIHGDIELYPGVFNVALGASALPNGGDPLNSSRALGIIAVAGNSTSGYNYGLTGILQGQQYGTGVYGGFVWPDYISGRYAGYFNGNVYVNGTINATLVTNADIRYKQNITELSGKQASVLQNILNLNPIEYSLKQLNIAPVSDTTTVGQKLFDEKSQIFQKKHYGLIAQEVQQLYPDLVYEGDDGYLSIDYTSVIPLLIASVKELNVKIEKLENDAIQKTAPATTGITDIQGGRAILYQNAPNPFNQSTQIKYYLPATVKTAYLCIYDLQGAQLKQLAIEERGEGVQTLYGSELNAGMYLYTLIADGQEMDTERMILTK